MKTSYSNRSSRPSVDSVMTPMIDVVFLLLIFFLSTSSFQRQEKALQSAVAAAPDAIRQGNKSENEPPPDSTDLSDVIVKIRRTVDLQPDGVVEYSINGEAIASQEILTQRLVSILKIRTDVPIVIDPENSVPIGEAIRVYDIARANGSVKVFFGVQ